MKPRKNSKKSQKPMMCCQTRKNGRCMTCMARRVCTTMLDSLMMSLLAEDTVISTSSSAAQRRSSGSSLALTTPFPKYLEVASSQETCSNNLLQDFLPTTASSPPPFFPATPSLALGWLSSPAPVSGGPQGEATSVPPPHPPNTSTARGWSPKKWWRTARKRWLWKKTAWSSLAPSMAYSKPWMGAPDPAFAPSTCTSPLDPPALSQLSTVSASSGPALLLSAILFSLWGAGAGHGRPLQSSSPSPPQPLVPLVLFSLVAVATGSVVLSISEGISFMVGELFVCAHYLCEILSGLKLQWKGSDAGYCFAAWFVLLIL